MENQLSKNNVISILTKSPHGDLDQYALVGLRAVKEDADFYSHLVAWNHKNGVIRDAKVALPVLALTNQALVDDKELFDNAMAHIVSLDPRNLVRAVRYSKAQPVKMRRALYRTVERYLREREASRPRFERVAMQHKASLKELYALLHVKPGAIAQKVLFDRSKTGVFAIVSQLKDMSPAEAAGAIAEKRIPFLVAKGALGDKAKAPVIVQALIASMSATELVTNAKALEKLGVKTDPALRATFEKALSEASGSGKAVLKTTRAAEAVGGSTGEKLRGVQEKQLDKLAVKGDWLVLADKSGSMQHSIETARHVSALLARVAEGNVHMVFFDTSPTYVNVTGMELDKIMALTKRVTAGGSTSPGCALQYAVEKGLLVDGIAIVGDANENSAPAFSNAYKAYSDLVGKEVPVYLYQLRGDQPNLIGNLQRANIDCQVFNLLQGVDYHSLPNLVQTMRVSRYSLVDSIMETPLLRLEDVFKLAA